MLETAGPFAITTPATAVTWKRGSKQKIAWSTAQTDKAPINCAAVKISLLSFNDGMETSVVLLELSPNTGSAEVSIPDTVRPTDSARLKIEAATNVFFTISPAPITIE